MHIKLLQRIFVYDSVTGGGGESEKPKKDRGVWEETVKI